MLSDIEAYQDKETGLINVSAKIDGVQMPTKQLGRLTSLQIGDPTTEREKVWAARMAYDAELRRNQRVSELNIYKHPNGDEMIRCKIDGQQQFSEQMKQEDYKLFKSGLLTEREIVDRYFSRSLVNERGETLAQTESHGRSMSLNQKKN